MRVHELGFAQELALEFLVLRQRALVALAGRETHKLLLCAAVSGYLYGGRVVRYCVVVERIHAVRQRVFEGLEIHRKCVPVEPEDVVRIDSADCLLHAVVERGQPGVFWSLSSAV